MGCPSVDIIVQELYKLGARRFLRVGTCGSMQPKRIRVGDLVVATAAVRDEHTSNAYLPREFPAVAAREFVAASDRAAAALGLADHTFFGTVHTKDSLFAREFGEGPMAPENERYVELLHAAGVLASEMEAAHLFLLASLWNQECTDHGTGPQHRVLAGTVLGVIGDDRPFAPAEEAAEAVDRAVDLALATVLHLARAERIPGS
jgi:uridine phosphorylase